MRALHLIYLFLLFASCKKTNRDLTKITAKTIAIDSTIQSSVKIDSIIAPYKEKLINEMEKVLSYTPKDLTKISIEMQSTLGNLMADMCFKMANPMFKENTKASIDFAMFNYGGLRAIIPAGKVTKEHAFKLMPFENELVVVNITGDKVAELVNYFIKNKEAHPLSKNIALIIIKENNYALKINNKEFDNNKTYNVLTSDFLQSGGDKMNFFKNPKKLTKLDYKVRDAIISYLEKVDTLKTTIDKRVTIK
jgi:2',3'-cyclic-nucleotide 2'-phosphodiesterase (5'-nucleotidase family)